VTSAKKCQVRCENSVWKTPRCTHAATHITSEQRRTPLIIIELRLQNQTRRRRKSSGKEGNLTDIFTTVKKNKKNYLHLCGVALVRQMDCGDGDAEAEAKVFATMQFFSCEAEIPITQRSCV
jgi:hypothetical protein